jgi:DNA-binding NarL/FixJ family response regulator
LFTTIGEREIRPEEMGVRILIVDDNAPIRAGLRLALESHDDWEVCGEAATGLKPLKNTANSDLIS